MGQNVYIYQAALLCEGCGEARRASIACVAPSRVPAEADNESVFDSDNYPQGPYSNGGGEADTPQHCDACGRFLENPLTPDGVEYVKDHMRSRPDAGGTAWRVWAPFYGLASGDL